MTTGYQLQAADTVMFSEVVKEIVSNGLSLTNYQADSGYTTPAIGDVVELSGGKLILINTAGNAMGVVTLQKDAANAIWQVVTFGAVVDGSKLNYNSKSASGVNAALKAFGIKVV
jgi:hypothetical protein